MSTALRRLPVGDVAVARAMRGLALLAALALISAFLSVLFALVDVAGDPAGFGLLVAASLVAATVLSRLIRVTHALLVGTVLLAVGLGWYVLSLPYEPRLVAVVGSNVELLTGQSLHQIRQADVWATAVTPGPVFVTWYLALRRWYGTAVLVGAATLGYFVLTNDAGTTVTLLGVVGAAGLLGFGDLDRRSGSAAGAEYVVLVLALMVVAPLVVTVVPGGAASPIHLGGGDGAATLEGTLFDTDGQARIVGDTQLSPQVRFRVQSQEGHYWRAVAYDRYTGQGWVRTGGTEAYDPARLSGPPGPTKRLAQRVTVESPLSTVPAAWRPVRVGDGLAGRTEITDQGDVLATEPLEAGAEYVVTSRVLTVDDETLWSVRATPPAEIRQRYTKLPESTPDRVERRTARITANAEGPYETALVIEEWLEQNREYSLSVDRPSGDVADAFLFEMERGYCTYYATTMVAMLRAEGVPARYVTGYVPGEQVGTENWVVRGLDSHAWVEVYFADVGWVAFDPTPGGPRAQAEESRIETARENNETNVDVPETLNRTRTPSADPEPENASGGDSPQLGPDPEVFDPTSGIVEGGGVDVGTVDETADGGDDGLPPREHIALAAVVLAGSVAGLRRSGLGRWGVRSVRVRWQRRVDPETDVERAFERLEILLSRYYRPRRTGETVREYLEAVDPPAGAHRVAAIRERARYGETVDQAAADEAVRLVEELRGR